MHSWDHLQSPFEYKIEMASHSVHKSFRAAVFPFAASCPPFAVKFTLKCEKRDEATDTCWILSARSAAVAPLKSDCHFYTIYSSPGLIACFLSEQIFPGKVLYLSFISPVFRSLSLWKGFDMHLSQRQAFYTLPLTS